MYLPKKQTIEKVNSIPNNFYEFVENLNRKKTEIEDKKFANINQLIKQVFPEQKENKKYESLSLEKIMHQQNFDKKYFKIMDSISLSPKKVTIENPDQKNLLLWDLKIKIDGSVSKDQSLKRLEDIKLRMVYNQDLEIPREEKIYQNFLNSKNSKSSNFKQSSSSDFFKSTINSDNKTFYTSKNSFYKTSNNNNHNILNVNANSNTNYNNDSNKFENLSFHSYKSLSSCGNNSITYNNKTLDKKTNKKEILNNNNKSNNFNPRVFSKDKSTRVNFDKFNTIGENPFKINIYDTHRDITTAKRKVNLKNSDISISPRNIYSPYTDISYHSYKRIFDFDRLYGKNNTNRKFDNKPNKRIINLNNNEINNNINYNLSPKERVNNKENLNGILIKKPMNDNNEYKRISTAINSNRQYTLRRIDNLLKNFSNKAYEIN